LRPHQTITKTGTSQEKIGEPMVKKQRQIKPTMKRALIAEAGDKCANPGCPNWRTHIHHVKHWSVYKTHDSDHMIAVCPSCHDEIHHGKLKISDETLYSWKNIVRVPADFHRDHIYVEPAKEAKLLVGSLVLATTKPELVAIELSNANTLAFRILDEDIMLLSARINSVDGKEMLRVADNHVKVRRDDQIGFERRAGKVRVTLPAISKYVAPWVIERVQRQEPDYGSDGRFVASELEVVKPGLVRVKGLWMAPEGGIVITETALHLLRPNIAGPISLVGEGEKTILMFEGPIRAALFNFPP